MRKYWFSLILMSCLAAGCVKNEDDWLNLKPSTVLSNDQVWSDPELVLTVLANLYDRIPEYQELDQYGNFSDFDEAFPSSAGDYGRVKNQTYDYGNWSYWDYGYIRDINLFIEQAKEATTLDTADQHRFLAEAQFLRANVYFELVKRMGGVPLLLDTMRYNFSGDATYLQHPRNKESEIYDFVINELDSAAQYLPTAASIKSRATWGAAMAMKIRAALYAGSIAKHGASTPTVSLSGGEVGIPASQANHYYQIALQAAQQVIDSKLYSLYMKHPDDLATNFSDIFLDKNQNPEVIFVKDYLLKSRTTQFTVQNQPHSSTEEGSWSGWLNPSLNLAESFEKLDNTFAPFANTDGSGSYVKYDNIGDIFKDRDARLAGTIILPGSQFRGLNVDIWAGYQLADGSIISGSVLGQTKQLPGQNTKTEVVGFDGPIDQLEHCAQTGFYIRKYNDPAAGAGQIGSGSEVWWVRYRYAEVLLDGAEAAYELGQNAVAADYMNQVRARAGLTIPLKASDITFDRIVHERRVEFAFEGQELWDMKRWRLADKVWNGQSISASQILQNIGQATKNKSMMYGIWPYKLYDPGKPDNGKWIYKVVKPSEVTAAHQFRLGNYYSSISAVANNPKLVQNPNQ